MPSFTEVKVLQQQNMLNVHHMHTWVCTLFKWNFEQHIYTHTLIPIINRFASTNEPLSFNLWIAFLGICMDKIQIDFTPINDWRKTLYVACDVLFMIKNVVKLLMKTVTSQSHFVLWKKFFFLGGGGRCVLILGILFRSSKCGLRWSQMNIISLEMEYRTLL